jgi:alpha-beta hydrolase superfamily lysophospholipase
MEFRRQFPEIHEMVVEQLDFCHPWDFERLQGFRDHLVAKYDDGIPTLIVGHSMGGVIACAIADRFEKTEVRGIVTIYSPHTFLREIFPRGLDAPRELRPKIVSFGAIGDMIVLWGTRHPDATRHFRVLSTHRGSLVRNRRLSQIIAYRAKRELTKESRQAG